MPLYRGTIYKEEDGGGERWTNVYMLNSVDSFAAESAILAVVAIERAVHYDIVRFYNAHVVNVVNKADQRTIPLGAVGLLHHESAGVRLPLYCTYRVVFSDQTSKPEMKYLRRPGWTDQLTAGGSWDDDFVAEVQTLYADALIDIAEYVGPTGEPHITGTALATVQNRQLGWHRRTRPGFKRGWVPA